MPELNWCHVCIEFHILSISMDIPNVLVMCACVCMCHLYINVCACRGVPSICTFHINEIQQNHKIILGTTYSFGFWDICRLILKSFCMTFSLLLSNRCIQNKQACSTKYNIQITAIFDGHFCVYCWNYCLKCCYFEEVSKSSNKRIPVQILIFFFFCKFYFFFCKFYFF